MSGLHNCAQWLKYTVKAAAILNESRKIDILVRNLGRPARCYAIDHIRAISGDIEWGLHAPQTVAASLPHSTRTSRAGFGIEALRPRVAQEAPIGGATKKCHP